MSLKNILDQKKYQKKEIEKALREIKKTISISSFIKVTFDRSANFHEMYFSNLKLVAESDFLTDQDRNELINFLINQIVKLFFVKKNLETDSATEKLKAEFSVLLSLIKKASDIKISHEQIEKLIFTLFELRKVNLLSKREVEDFIFEISKKLSKNQDYFKAILEKFFSRKNLQKTSKNESELKRTRRNSIKII